MQYEFCFRKLSYLFRQEKDLTALALSMSSRRRRHPRCPWRRSSRRRRHPRCPSSLFRFRPNKISSLRRSKLVTYSVNNSFCRVELRTIPSSRVSGFDSLVLLPESESESPNFHAAELRDFWGNSESEINPQ